MTGPNVYQSNGQCAPMPLGGLAPLAPGPLKIRNSVGRNGVNGPDDVRAIQQALNLVSTYKGGAEPKLKEDGLIGNKTVGAITHYQQVNFFGWADGRVDPDKPTHRLLTQDAYPYDAPDEEVVISALMLVPRMRTCIMAAEATLDLATAGQNAALATVNHFFALNLFPNPGVEMEFVRKIYRRMSQVLARGYQNRESQWTGVFVPNVLPFEDGRAWAFTWSGGTDLDGRSLPNPDFPLRADRIYICRNFLRELNDAYRVFALIHELAHYVGPAGGSPNEVAHHGGPVRSDSSRLQSLLPWQRTHNADVYALFAYQRVYGPGPEC